ncbi:MAG: NAD-dependent epimerase/dehydratase family protein [Anaerolineae bacterium]|nr:NAD-dependent epimerase/dehydratase family protein [Anaerolineae bacterium]
MPDTQRVFLVTGAMGCIGAWTLYHLRRRGEQVVSFDLSDNRARVNLLLTPDEQADIRFVRGDLTDTQQVSAALTAHGVTHIIHLAALQVPFCRANPVLGAQVNVVGTVNIFEAAKQAGLRHVAYASSIAVYGKPDEYPPGLLAADAPFRPHTLYGVYKVADEGIARVYWQDYQISSTALRPYTVYGLGRDQGLTSEPTYAMQAAVAGVPYSITFNGTMQFHWASDVAQQFIDSALYPLDGAFGFNLGGVPVSVETVADLIRRFRPQAAITVAEKRLPFPEGFDDSELRRHFPTVYDTPLEDGIRETLEQMGLRLADGRLRP